MASDEVEVKVGRLVNGHGAALRRCVSICISLEFHDCSWSLLQGGATCPTGGRLPQTRQIHTRNGSVGSLHLTRNSSRKHHIAGVPVGAGLNPNRAGHYDEGMKPIQEVTVAERTTAVSSSAAFAFSCAPEILGSPCRRVGSLGTHSQHHPARVRPDLFAVVRAEWEGLEKIRRRGALLVATTPGHPSDARSSCTASRRNSAPRLRHGRLLLPDRPVSARVGRAGAWRPDRTMRIASSTTGATGARLPEGTKGPSKSFTDRYQLRRFGRGDSWRLRCEQACPSSLSR